MMQPLVLTASTAVSAAGCGVAAHREALLGRTSGLVPNDFDPAIGGWIGRVRGIEAYALPAAMAGFDCRNNRLADMALRTDGFADAVAEACAEYGPDRIAVVRGPRTRGLHAAADPYSPRDGDGPRSAPTSAPRSGCAARRWSCRPPAPPAPAASWTRRSSSAPACATPPWWGAPTACAA